MADDALSENEIDALLKDVEEGEAAPAPAADTSKPQSFSLGNQERIVRGRMPTFENIHERFIRLFRISMSTFLSRLVEIKATAVETCKYSEFVAKHKNPTNINLLKIKPLRATNLMIIDPELVLFVVDNLFGGGGRFKTSAVDREFTPTELRIVVRILEVFFEPYAEAWAPVHPIEYEYIRSEMNMQFANIAMMSEVVVTTTFTVEIEEKSYEMEICIPYSALEPIRDLLTSQMQGRVQDVDIKWIEMLHETVQSVELEIKANLGSKKLLLEEVVDMKIGDLIQLEYNPFVIATTDDVPIFECRYGTYNKKHALKIEKFLQSNLNEYVRTTEDEQPE